MEATVSVFEQVTDKQPDELVHDSTLVIVLSKSILTDREFTPPGHSR